MGTLSQIAQGLTQPITSLQCIQQQNHVVILLVTDKCCLGLHKVGIKHLHQYDTNGTSHEIIAYCCLDFYVHESQQKRGLGKLLFDIGELVLGVKGQFWAYDRPSSKLYSFLKKYYNFQTIQQNYTLQVSHFAMDMVALKHAGDAFSQLRKEQRMKRAPIGNEEELIYDYYSDLVKCKVLDKGYCGRLQLDEISGAMFNGIRSNLKIVSRSISEKKYQVFQPAVKQTCVHISRSENVEDINGYVASKSNQNYKPTGFW